MRKIWPRSFQAWRCKKRCPLRGGASGSRWTLDLDPAAMASRGMRTKPLVKLLSVGLLAALLLAWAPWAHAADPDDPTPPVVALGNDTYVLTRGAKFFYFRDTTKLVKLARTDAQKFCRDMGREMKELSVEEIKGGLVFGNFSKARITFKALAPSDPALAETKSPTATAPAATLPAGGSDLTKLEDLHRSGVLANSEFDAAKKRLALRSLEELHNNGVLSDSEFEAAHKRLRER